MPIDLDLIFTDPKFQQEYEKMPIFQEYIESCQPDPELSKFKVGFAHVLAPNTLPLLILLHLKGFALEIILENGNSYDPSIVDLLKNTGFTILKTVESSVVYDLTVDVGGFFVKHPPNIGSVEVTKSGIHKYKESDNSYRLIDVDTSKTKLIETFLGNPKATLEALQLFAGFDPADETVNDFCIVGFGKIGRGIASKLQTYGKVIVCDISDSALMKARDLGFETVKISSDITLNSERIKHSNLIITATGHKNVMTTNFDKTLLTDALKINLGAVDEWGSDYTQNDVFRSKFKPFNFNLNPPTDSKYIDPILMLQYLGLLYLANNYKTLPRDYTKIPQILDDEVFEKFNQLYNNEAQILYHYFDLN